jgi:hypothetical protein
MSEYGARARESEEYRKDSHTNRVHELFYKFKFFLRRGQREYCVRCLPSWDLYSYWLINTRRAKLKPVTECHHQ